MVAPTSRVEQVERTVEQIATASAVDAIRALTPSRVVERSDVGAVEVWLSESRRHPRRGTEVGYREVVRATTINGAPVADVLLSSLGATGAGAFVNPAPTASPFDPSIEAGAPLLAAVGLQVHSPDALTHVTWPTGLIADTVPDHATDKTMLPTGEVAVGASDPNAVTSGLTVNLSGQALEFMRATGRSAWISDYLFSQTWRSSEAYLVAELTAQVATEAADLSEALAAIEAPYSASLLAGPVTLLAAENLLNLTAAGLQIVASPALSQLLVLDRLAIEAHYGEPMLLSKPEPERAGVLLSCSHRISVKVNANGVARVAVTP